MFSISEKYYSTRRRGEVFRYIRKTKIEQRVSRLVSVYTIVQYAHIRILKIRLTHVMNSYLRYSDTLD